MTTADKEAHLARKAKWAEWESEYADKITDSINFVRIARGYTIKDLTKRLTDIGWPATVSTLNGMLSSKKRSSYSVSDIFAFALALNVPPAVLMFALPSPGTTLPGPLFEADTPLEQLPFWFDAPQLADEVSGAPSLTSLPQTLANYYDSLHSVMFHNRMMIAANDPRFDEEAVERMLPSHKNGKHLRYSITQLGDAVDAIKSIERFDDLMPPIEVTPLPEALKEAVDVYLLDDLVELPLVGINSQEELEDARRRVANITEHAKKLGTHGQTS